MADVSQHLLELDYSSPHRPTPTCCHRRWTVLAVDAALILVATFAVAALVAAVRVAVLLITPSNALFGLPW